MMLVPYVLAFLVSPVCAHDEGHGPKLTDSPRQGGVLAAVVNAKDAKLGAKAPLVFKAELVRLADGTVQLYLYDAKLEPLALASFAEAATGEMQTRVQKKWRTIEFPMKRGAESYSGTLPKPPAKPYNIDVTFSEGDRKLLAAFDNLD